MIRRLHAELGIAAGVFTGGVQSRMIPAGYAAGMSPEQHANEVLEALARGETDIFAGVNSGAANERLCADPLEFERKNIDRCFGSQAAQ